MFHVKHFGKIARNIDCMIPELRRGFEIGSVVALLFLVIDMIVSAAAMSTGMMMLPPPAIALSIKFLFVILIDILIEDETF